MIGAGEGAGLTGVLGYLGAAMPANVEERAQPSIAAAHQQNWHAGIVIGAVGAGARPFRGEAHQQWMPAEQLLLLASEMLRIGVDRHVVAPGRIGQAGGPGLDVVQQALQKIDLPLPLHRCLLAF